MKYKGKENKISKLIIVIVILCFILTIIYITQRVIVINSETTNADNIIPDENYENISNIETTSIENIFKLYDIELHTKVKSYDKSYTVYYVNFKYNLYENDESKEKYFTNIVNKLNSVIDTTYKLKDGDKNIEIYVEYNEQTHERAIYINDELNFFELNRSIQEMLTYQKSENVNIILNAKILIDLNSANWIKGKVKTIGVKDSEENGYQIFKENGYKLKMKSGKIINIVFNTTFENELINDLKVGSTSTEIEAKFGTPTFEDKRTNMMGYQNNDMYVFFYEDEISMHRKESYYNEDLEGILEKYLYSENDDIIKNLRKDIDENSSDYDEIEETDGVLIITYYYRGIKITYDTQTGFEIIIYNNYDLTNNTEQLVRNEKIIIEFGKDLIAEYEVLRKTI